MITKFEKFQIIKETPDTLYTDDNAELSYEDDDAMPFFINANFDHTKVEEIYIGSNGETHGDIQPYKDPRAYPGRLWLKAKYMAFWVYPNPIIFKSIIENLENELGIEIFNNGWKIEIINVEDNYMKVDSNTDEDELYYYDNPNRDNTKVVPIEKYVGSDDVPEELQIQHLMNWQEKELAKKAGKLHFKGFGSDRTAWDSKHNIKYRQAIRTSENKKFK